MATRTLQARSRLRGELRVPGDKSISHRSLIFGAVAQGGTRVRGLAPGGDVRTTRRALEALGVAVEDTGGTIVVRGRGWDGLHRTGHVDLDCGNSGTTTRLLLGLLAGGRGTFRLTGDASLSARPMRRVTRHLAAFGASIEGGDTLPLVVRGAPLHAAEVRLDVPSAQVETALVLAALQASGTSTIERDPRPARDHTTRMLRAMGAPIEDIRGGWRVHGGGPRLAPLDMEIPGDPSSAAYAVALACLLPGSEITVRNLCLNPRRTGFYRLLQRMGADVSWTVEQDAPEPVGTLVARSSRLHGIEVEPGIVPDAIDEIPLLAVVAAAADGPSSIRGIEELRVKESDRVAATVELLRAFAAEATDEGDAMAIAGGALFRPAHVDAHHDHRIAMCAAVAASISPAGSAVDGAEWVEISYPGFFADLERLSG